ncbi:MAG: hypothetical protein LBI29_02120 [Rickettsiales bacterium]|nr:hypothetical protein [Rickettsiales bacterium]
MLRELILVAPISIACAGPVRAMLMESICAWGDFGNGEKSDIENNLSEYRVEETLEERKIKKTFR